MFRKKMTQKYIQYTKIAVAERFITTLKNKIYKFDLRNKGLKPEKKQFFKKLFCKFSIDYCDKSSSYCAQSSSDNLYIKLLTSST